MNTNEDGHREVSYSKALMLNTVQRMELERLFRLKIPTDLVTQDDVLTFILKHNSGQQVFDVFLDQISRMPLLPSNNPKPPSKLSQSPSIVNYNSHNSGWFNKDQLRVRPVAPLAPYKNFQEAQPLARSTNLFNLSASGKPENSTVYKKPQQDILDPELERLNVRISNMNKLIKRPVGFTPAQARGEYQHKQDNVRIQAERLREFKYF